MRKAVMKYISISVIVFLLICGSFSNSMTASNNPVNLDDNYYPKATTTLDYLEYDTRYTSGSDLYNESWYFNYQFNSQNTNVSITVYLMDNLNFLKWHFGNYTGLQIFLVAEGITGFGQYQIPYNDLWIVVFFNNDTSMQSTTLDFSVVFHYDEDYTPITTTPPYTPPPAPTPSYDLLDHFLAALPVIGTALVFLIIMIIVVVRRVRV